MAKASTCELCGKYFSKSGYEHNPGKSYCAKCYMEYSHICRLLEKMQERRNTSEEDSPDIS